MFPEYKEINWSNWYELDKFIVFDVPGKWIPFNLFTRIERYLIEWNSIPKFDDNRNIIDSIYSDYILVEYNNESIRNKDIKIINNKINIISPLKTEIIDWNKQLANPVWNFELDWKYYLVLNPYNPFSDELNKEKWIYKWVIVNPELYFWEADKEVVWVKDKLDNII